MNLAFPALCLLLIGLPGIFFRQSYSKASVPLPGSAKSFSNAVNKFPISIRPISEEIALSLVWSIILHIVWLSLATFVHKWTHFDEKIHFDAINYENIVIILNGSSNIDKDVYLDALKYLADSRYGLVWYFVSLYFASFVGGRLALQLIRWGKFDLKFVTLRLQDQWFYFLRGEIVEFVEFKRYLQAPVPKIAGTYVSVVVEQGSGDFLYKGFLWDFHLDKEGNLDRLVLHHVIRSPFYPSSSNKDQSQSSDISVGSDLSIPTDEDTLIVAGRFKYETISSQLFTVRYADCKTLACTYFYLRKEKDKSKRSAG